MISLVSFLPLSTLSFLHYHKLQSRKLHRSDQPHRTFVTARQSVQKLLDDLALSSTDIHPPPRTVFVGGKGTHDNYNIFQGISIFISTDFALGMGYKEESARLRYQVVWQ